MKAISHLSTVHKTKNRIIGKDTYRISNTVYKSLIRQTTLDYKVAGHVLMGPYI